MPGAARARRLVATVVGGALLTTGMASAHTVDPARLVLRELGPGVFDVSVELATDRAGRTDPSLRLPLSCRSTEPAEHELAGRRLVRSRIRCSGSIVGEIISIDPASFPAGNVLVRVERLDGSSQTARLTPDDRGFSVAQGAGTGEVAGLYLRLGIEHVLSGMDHMLFVVALLLLALAPVRATRTLAAFLIGQALSLGVATRGRIEIAGAPVEAWLALALACVAVEVVCRTQGRVGLATRHPEPVACAFGLLQGLGFAVALRDVGLPAGSVAAATGSYLLGLLIGQLLVAVGAAVAGIALARRLVSPASGTAALLRPAAYAIGIPAAFWLIERSLRVVGG